MLTHDVLWWCKREFKDVSSYTTSSAPVWLQDSLQSLFRNVMILHTCELLRTTNAGHSLGKVVDLACGPGDWTLRYLEIAERVVGVDINPEFIDAGRRAAAGLHDPERAEFLHMNLLDYDDYRDADLVSMGACLQCMNDTEVNTLFTNMTGSIRPGAWVYVRTNVANPSKGSYSTNNGRYRSKRDYEKLFSDNGLKVLDNFTSFSVVPSELMREFVGVRSVKIARLLASPIWLLHHLLRQLFTRSFHYNWFLERS